ncbi:phosphocholine-specific phospholipase C [Pedosphaera parvula]|uniref:Phospholipase C, phosphocholine-specific n=1 Tax=Pedosphaera parvula (strain Ellin514) TaxID=320771 RepID=B9XRA0_PEDPL|nr:phospholipase C, phosphocholine-specific [Pedosphaera parvula]EEF57643.1 phospholipase C, phosphocholine-specific [Pedosphaera parvula Ellin514]
MQTSASKILFAIVVLSTIFRPLMGVAQVQHHVAAANLLVLQNDTSNNTASVTVSTTLSINDFRIRPGSSRADYNVQIGAISTDDVANGILMGSINQNGRDNGEDAFPGMNYGTCSIDSNSSSSPGSSGEYWLPVFQAPNNSEYNFNVAAAWFPYSDGWYGGWLNNASGVNGGANNHLIGNPALTLGTHVVDEGGGQTLVDLRPFGLNSSNAVLLVEGGKNEANFALSATNGDGTWTITCHDDNGGVEQDYVGFVCVPLTNHTVVSGKFMGDAKVAMQSQIIQVVNSGVGTYHLTIPGVNPNNGVLIISPDNGGTINGDNMVSYQINGNGWDIQTRDITSGFTPALQTLPDTDAVVSFVYIPGPTPGSTTLRWSGATGTNWDFSTNQTWRLVPSNLSTNYTDACQTILDDTASNFAVNLTASVSPYQLIVSNTANNYLINGTGSIIGSTGLTKQGSGKLTLAVTNKYTGDTLISQGTLALNANGCIPGGAGYGNTFVNGTLDLAGFNCTLNNLSGIGLVDDSTAGGAPQLNVYETTNTTFSGTLKNTTGSLSLTLDGGGALTLTGINTFSGGCTISNGTLVVKGTLGSGPVTVQSNGQLSGTGTISGPISMVGNSALDLTANAALTTGPITLNGSVPVNVISGVALTHTGTYLLLKHGSISGSGSFKLVLPPGLQANGFTASLVDTGTQLQLVVTAAGITGTIADVRHVVLFMNENRAFDHYFGTHYGVRGFNDRNALQFTNGNNVFYQPTGSSYELPFHNTLQCLTDLNHSWPVTHSTVNGGKNDGWIPNKGAETMCYFERSDLPFYYALADAFTICDEYHCSVLSSTDPNRISYMTGMIDPHGIGGGPEIDNSSVPTGFTWKTYPEFLQQAGISWKVYSVSGDNGENVLQMFAAYKQATAGNPLYDRGRAAYSSQSTMVSGFASDVANNRLPSVSWIVGTGDYCEHPPHSSANGEVLLKQVLDALAANPQVYNSTVFIFNYDENDGFYDHAMPILPPPGTPDEYVGSQPIGLGIRVPAIIVSPWSRGGRVCSQVFDHTSITRFLETWTGVTNSNISAWRRQVCGDMTSAFDFAHPNPDYPIIPGVATVECPVGETPAVPSPQSFPIQESGSMVPMPLPYQPDASCTLNSATSTFTITMTNTGAASVHFGVYANAFRTDGPWPFDVDTTGSANASFSTTATAGKYDFTCYGPNGFQRRFAGSISSDFQKIEAVSVLNPANAGIKIALANSSSTAVTFTVTNGYVVAGSANYIVPAHTTNLINVGSETNNGFYDITVKASADAAFVRRFLGRVEAYVTPMVSGGKLLTNGAFQFSFSGPLAQPFHVMATTNLSNPSSWVSVMSGTFGTDPVTYTETNPSAQSARFYHVVSP